ncbi:hypothetical protein FSP39_016572 [Pinctada imbricata]|uniref:UDENN domain-containing protein n=1 Tax=Pinctada imbricata TaxID=66713 RepID=A0AA88Y2V3_PINIB|nr:hypothetical protein FSP39_016572 [Pinctada imbricata]
MYRRCNPISYPSPNGTKRASHRPIGMNPSPGPLQECPDKLFEVFLEVAKPDGQHEEPFIVQQYPPDHNDEDTLKNVPKFAFPCDTERTAVDHFTFVLTDLDGKLKFGYCRHSTGAQTCLCIVSCLPWFEVFYNLLNTLAEIQNNHEDADLTDFLRAAYAHEVPAPGVPVTIVAGQEMMNFTSPDTSKLPSIPTNRNLTEYYNALDTENMMIIFASMLHERRIIITSNKLNRLTACVHSSADLLYPMHWQHLFIPVLPTFLKDYLSAPMPYLIGVHKSILETIKEAELDDAMIVDVDKNKIETQYLDFEALPLEISSYLKKHLKGDKVRTMMQSKGDTIPKAFLMAMVKLIGGYRDALKFQSGELITFCPETFVRSRPESMQPFLEKILHLQIFQQFINGRLDMLNTGVGFSDIFEQLSMASADKLNSQSRYKEWLNTMKMKVQSKKAYSGIKSKIADTISKKPLRPQAPPSPSTQSLKVGVIDRPTRRISKLEERSSLDDSDPGLSYNRVSINLLADPDIQNALNKSSSAGTLPVDDSEEVLLQFDSSSDTSSGRGSPGFTKLVDIDSTDTGSTSTQDSFGQIPYIDSAIESQGNTTASSVGSESETRPVPPPRRHRATKTQNTAAKTQNPSADKLIATPRKPQPPAKDKLIVQDKLISPRPKPRPRTNSTEGIGPNVRLSTSTPKTDKTLSTSPLVRLESCEEDFDPFRSPNSLTVGRLDALRASKHDEPTLNRTPAFNKGNIEGPLRLAKPDFSPELSPERELENKKTDDFLSDFDPLSERKNNATSAAKDQTPELLQNWGLTNLRVTDSASSNPSVQNRTSPKPQLHRPLTRLANQAPGASFKPPLMTKPVVPPSMRTSRPAETSPAKRSSDDPFEDLLNLSLTNPSSQPTWEKFD